VDTEILCACATGDGRVRLDRDAFCVRRGPGEARRKGGAPVARAAELVRLDAGGRRAADYGAAGGLEGVPVGAAEPVGKRGECFEGAVEWP